MPEFERRNPGIRVRVQQIPWTAAHEKLLTALRRRRDARPRAARQHLDPRVRRARRARAARRAASRPIRRAWTRRVLPGIWNTNVVDGRSTASPGTSTRASSSTATICSRGRASPAAPTWSEWRRAMEASRRELGRGQYRDLPADQRVGAAGRPRHAGGLAAARRRRPLRRLLATRRSAGPSTSTSGSFATASRRRRQRADREPLPGVRARATSRCASPGRGTSASSATGCRPRCRTSG